MAPGVGGVGGDGSDVVDEGFWADAQCEALADDGGECVVEESSGFEGDEALAGALGDEHADAAALDDQAVLDEEGEGLAAVAGLIRYVVAYWVVDMTWSPSASALMRIWWRMSSAIWM